MAVTRRKLLGELLLEKKLVTEEQLKEALEEQKRTGDRLGQILLEHGYVSTDKVGEVLELQTGYPYASLHNIEIPIEVVNLVSEDVARRYRVFPIKRERGKLHLAMATPGDLWAIDEVKLITGFEVVPYVSTMSEILTVINRSYNMDSTVKEIADEILVTKEEEAEPAAPAPAEDVARLVEEPPVIRLVNKILSGATHSGATDVHLDPQGKSCRVRYRVDGMLYDTMEIPESTTPLVTSRIKIMSNLDISEHRKAQDGRFSAEIENKSYDLRVAIIPTTDGEKVVMRILDRDKMLFSLDQLGLFQDEQKTLERLVRRPYGIILASGPTGSGKTTTLYAILQRLNVTTKNIITIEDPVEYHFPGINQIQVSPKGGISFATGLRSILRQDPDIIVVGEIRDEETAKIVVEAGITGHLVLSTLHTNDVPTTITRLMEMGIDLHLLASSIIGVISQRLVRCVCAFCSQEEEVKDGFYDEIKNTKILDEKIDIHLKRGKGCKHCLNTGYRGRTGIFEIMPLKKEIRELILRGTSADMIREETIKLGMRSVYHSGLYKVAQGITTLDEVKRVAYREEE